MSPQLPLKDVRFHNPRLARLGVEVMTLEELRERAAPALGAPERLDFLLVLLVEGGRATHMVDFLDHELRPGTVLLVRPGQVHQWRMTKALQGQLMLVTAEALSAGRPELQLLALDDWPATSAPGRWVFQAASTDCGRLRTDIANFSEHPIEAALVRHELMALLLRLARERAATAPAAVPSREAEIHRLFVRELEASFQQRLSVLDYARRIGYSESTLSRACLAVVGHTAKQAVDLRVALEAKRLLVHSDASAVQIGHGLGFSEPTNFVKFFRRMVGMTPMEFRGQGRSS